MKAFGRIFAVIAALGAPAVLADPSLQVREPQGPSVTATSGSSSPYGYAPPRYSGTPGTAAALNSTSVGIGDVQCSTTMCIEALVQGNTIQYTLSSRRAAVGWMAMGFGTRMANTPMVIMWTNPDGSLTLSQRQAPATIMPTVVPNPPRVATAQPSLSVTSGSDLPKFVYTIPANPGETRQNVIYAFGAVRPSSASPDATLIQHIDEGDFMLDLTKRLNGSANPSGSGSASGGIPLTSADKMIVAHGIIAAIGFIFFLPIGALVPRYARTFIAGPTWFKTHWIVQFVFAGIVIIIGCALGFASVSNRGVPHVNTTHKRLGVVLFAIYFLQLGIGAFIHFVKPEQPRKRPAQNYFHAIFGLLIIGLALAQVRIGFNREWTRATGRTEVPNGINIVWWIWVVLLPVLYGAGLFFLKKQYDQERKARENYSR